MPLKLITQKRINQIEQDMSTAVLIATRKYINPATGKTERSIETVVSERTDTVIGFSTSGAGAIPFVIEGKPANTKLPVRKTANGFELVTDLQEWKKIRGFGGSDYLLARSIARKAKAPVDLGAESLRVFDQINRNKDLIDTFTENLANNIEDGFK